MSPPIVLEQWDLNKDTMVATLRFRNTSSKPYLLQKWHIGHCANRGTKVTYRDFPPDVEIGPNEIYEREFLLSINGGTLQILNNENTPVLTKSYGSIDIKQGVSVFSDQRFGG